MAAAEEHAATGEDGTGADAADSNSYWMSSSVGAWACPISRQETNGKHPYVTPSPFRTRFRRACLTRVRWCVPRATGS